MTEVTIGSTGDAIGFALAVTLEDLNVANLDGRGFPITRIYVVCRSPIYFAIWLRTPRARDYICRARYYGHTAPCHHPELGAGATGPSWCVPRRGDAPRRRRPLR